MTWTRRLNKKPCSTMYLTFRDVRNLVEPSLSLAGLGRRYGIQDNEGKGTFPHSSNRCLWTLKTTCSLPPEDSPDWFNDLSGQKIPLPEIRQALEAFQRGGFSNRYDYLSHYLRLDVNTLNFGFWNIWSDWKSRGINLVVSRLFTISKVKKNLFLQRKKNNKPTVKVFSGGFLFLLHLLTVWKTRACSTCS